MHNVGGLVEKVFGGKVRQGNQVYATDNVSPTLLAGPVGNLGGNSPLILIKKKEK